ncbi:SGNH/GDSL hydrolase family protein [Marinimicrobium agarilyticum]|uniref:SGNH/GDSL hydrolase family protein n=1 Tax=Marinimicrobium agarilyticum TaxID=306546 RepID=UPI0004082D04|nr:SGNH/GDSL hydrolase family protein [Marinimicrobium agarilyticum]
MRNVWLLSALVLLAACALESPGELAGEKGVEDLEPASARLIGRFDVRESGSAAFTWPGSAMAFRFSGTAASLKIQSAGRVRFQVTVDGGEGADLWVSEGLHRYELVSGLSAGEHTIRITRLGESFEGTTVFASAPEVEGRLLSPPTAPQRQLLFLGDSITAGYGVEGETAQCPYAQETSNPLLTYASVAADALDAEAHLIAWSGIGVWRSYGEDVSEQPTLIERRRRTLALEPQPQWDVQRYRPDAVMIAIGTNDFWTGSAPGYHNAMQSLLAQLRTDYPRVPFYLIASPMLSAEARESQVAVLQSLANDNNIHFLDLGKIEPEEGYGCDYHPNVMTQARLGHNLEKVLARDLGWGG